MRVCVVNGFSELSFTSTWMYVSPIRSRVSGFCSRIKPKLSIDRLGEIPKWKKEKRDKYLMVVNYGD